uniref:Uncharacterized protein n=1 Tax=Fagus sylvatica TaxID=28930 RepID=A0A2N9ISZ3_FAGSY
MAGEDKWTRTQRARRSGWSLLNEKPEGHSNTNATPPRPPTPPKPEGKDSQLDSKIDSLEEKIRLIQGLNSFGNTDFSSMSWFPNMTVPPKFKAPEFEKYNGRGDPMIHLQMYCRKMAPYADNEPLLIQTFQDTLTGNAAEWYSQLKKISHWKELADTFLAQYGFNSQIAPDRFDLQRMEKKSNETFREYAQRWREKAARARPPLDEREMIKIFVDTLKNPYFDRMIGLQMQFFVDLIPVGERIEDALKTKKIVDMTALMALAEQAAKKAPTKKKEGDVQMIGRKQRKTKASLLPTFTMQPIQPRPIPMPAPSSSSRLRPREEPNLTCCPEDLTTARKEGISTQNSTCDFHFGEVGHTVKIANQLRHRVQDLIDHGILKFEGLPNITTNPLPNHPEGGVNMVEIEERGEETYRVEDVSFIPWRSRDTSPLGREEIPSKGSHQPDDPSDFDWYAELNLDDIVEDEMDLDNLQDEGADWGYFMEDDTDEWRDVDFTKFFQFPCLIVPPGFETPEFEIFYENGDPEVHLQKYGEKMALHLENELLMISVFPESLSKQAAAWFYQLRNLTGWDDLARVFLERYRFNPHSILEYLGLKEDEEPYIIPDPGVNEVIVEIKEESSMSSLPALTEGEEEEKAKPLPPAKDPDSIAIAEEGEEPVKTPPPSNITTTTAEEEYAGPMVEGLSIHTIAEEEDSTTTPPTRHCQQGEEAKMWTCVPLLQRVSSSNEETRRGVQTQHRGVGNHKSGLMKGEEPREVKIGTRCTTEQKEALIALLREFHEIFAWSYQDMPGLDTDIVVHKIPLKPECKPVKQALRRMKPEVILKIKEEVEKQLKAGFLSTVTYSDWVANIVPVPKKDGKVRMCVDYRDLNRASPKDNFPLPHIDTLVDNTATNAVFSFMDGFSGYNQIKMAEEDKSKTAFVTHWGTFVYDVMPFGLKNAGATYQRAMVTLFHDMIHHEIEVYVDDMIAKSRTAQDHLTDLRKLFQRLKKYQLRLNPNKCAFGVTSGKTSPHSIPHSPRSIHGLHVGTTRRDWEERSKAIYYLSKKFTEPETRYLLVEKTCCALAWASKKLRQYMLYYTTWLVSRMDPIKYIFEKPALTGKIARMASGSFTLMEQRTLSEVGLARSWYRQRDNKLLSLLSWGFDCTNNMTEYEACIVGLQAALEFGAYELEVFGDSLLIVSQTNGEWQARDPKLIPYQRYISRLVPKFKYVTFTYTPRAHNHFADALATLASLIKLVEGDDVRPLRIETRDIPAYCVCVEECMNVEAEIDNKPWYYDIKRFIQDREFCTNGTHDATLLRCVDAEEANRLIQEMHAGLMGAHANGPFLARKIMRAGYYWLTMERDCIRHVQTCHKCQMYQNSKNAPPQYLHTMASPWPFSAWGMDVIGAITPKASNGHEFILVAIDYFTKWVEACSFKNVTQVAVTRFVKNNIICRYGMPEMLITDNASNLNNRMMDQLCQQFKIQHHNSAPYRPKMNGAVEAANKNVKKILSKMTETYKDWHEHLPYALCAYRTSVRTSCWSHPLLSGIWDGSSTASRSGDPFFENPVTNSAGRSLNGPKHELTTRRLDLALSKPGDLVLKKRNMALSDPRGKFAPSYEGPYVVKKAFSGGAIILADMDGEEFRSPINSDSVIKYHV